MARFTHQLTCISPIGCAYLDFNVMFFAWGFRIVLRTRPLKGVAAPFCSPSHRWISPDFVDPNSDSVTNGPFPASLRPMAPRIVAHGPFQRDELSFSKHHHCLPADSRRVDILTDGCIDAQPKPNRSPELGGQPQDSTGWWSCVSTRSRMDSGRTWFPHDDHGGEGVDCQAAPTPMGIAGPAVALRSCLLRASRPPAGCWCRCRRGQCAWGGVRLEDGMYPPTDRRAERRPCLTPAATDIRIRSRQFDMAQNLRNSIRIGGSRWGSKSPEEDERCRL